MRANLFWLTDTQWAKIEPHLPTGVRGNPRVDDRRVWTIFRRTVAPAAAAFQNMQDAADHTAIVDPRYATHICRQEGFDSRPLCVGQPEQIGSHGGEFSPKAAGENRHHADSARQL